MGVPFALFKSFVTYVRTQTPRVYLAEARGTSRELLSRQFQVFPQNPPHPLLVWKVNPPTISKTKDPWVYGFDGKWLGRGLVIPIHRDVTHKETLWWSDSPSESISAFTTDIKPVSHLVKDNPPSGAISDWKPGIVRVIGETWQGIPQQRCLVHVERDLKRLLPLHSPIEATQQLRAIAVTICYLPTLADRDRFVFQLELWHSEHESLLKEKTVPAAGATKKRWWYTHGNLRRAWRILTHDQGSLFRYLEEPLLPTTNNSLEGVNSHLARRRGLSKEYQVAMMFWQLALSRCKTPHLQRQLWVIWKQAVAARKSTQNIT